MRPPNNVCTIDGTDRSTVPSEDVWLSGVFGSKSVSLDYWNALPDSLRDPELTLDIFRRHLKTYFFTLYILDVSHVQRIRDFFW